MISQMIYHMSYNRGKQAGLTLREQANLCTRLLIREVHHDELDLLIKECKELLKNQE